MCLCSLKINKDLGLLILRVGIGAAFLVHGWPKLTGGPSAWTNLGMATGAIGIHFAPTFFGFMAASSEFFGGLCLIIGLGVRPASLLMLITMIVASMMHLKKGDGFNGASHAIEAAVVFLGLILTGAGDHSLDNQIVKRRKSCCSP